MVLKTNAAARQVWLNIGKLFRDNKDSRLMQLDCELRSIVMGDLTVNAYSSKIKNIADLLENLDANLKVADNHLVNYTINGLTSGFDNIATVIRHRVPFPTFS